MDPKTLFDVKLPAGLAKDPQRARELAAVFAFHVTGEGGGDWTVDLKADPPAVKPQLAANADCTVELSSEDLAAIIGDFGQAIQLYFAGRVKIAGDVTLATRLQAIFALV
jgi:alkyl sulfatase BDS1-like metallo-beta-lactamase superfamily hydrolase